MKYDSIFFDLDGTLLNTLEDLQDSANFALTQMNLPTHDLATIRSFVGNGIRKLVQRSLPQDSDDETINKALKLFHQYYNANMSKKTKPYDGIIQTLEKLQSKYKLAILSNKAESAVKYLNDFYFSQFNMLALGETQTRPRKPSPDIVHFAKKVLNVNKPLYIGDSLVDIATAKAANVDMLCVSWGFCDKNILQQSETKTIIDSPIEILDYL